MAEHDQNQPVSRLAGYAALIERYGLDIIPNWHMSRMTTSGIHRIDSRACTVEEVYPLKDWPGDTLGDHLEFALKYDGTNLAVLAGVFQKASEDALKSHSSTLPRPEPSVARRLLSKTAAGRGSEPRCRCPVP